MEIVVRLRDLLHILLLFRFFQREQMLAAHEMFKNANRVSRAEKALILGFMAGARGKYH